MLTMLLPTNEATAAAAAVVAAAAAAAAAATASVATAAARELRRRWRPPLHMLLRMLLRGNDVAAVAAAAAAVVVVIGIAVVVVVVGIDGNCNASGSATTPGRTTVFVCASSCARRRAHAAYIFFCDESALFCFTGDDGVVVNDVAVVLAAVLPSAPVAVAALVCCEHTLHFASSGCGAVASIPSTVRRVCLSADQ
jgi:hypothetical protein